MQNPSPGLGICAGIFLLAAQITVAAVSGCGCCQSRSIPSETKRVVGIVCTVASWIAAVIAFVLFVDGAAVNARGYYVKGGVYAGAGVLALATTALGIASFVMLRSPSQPADAAGLGADMPNKPVVGIPVGVHPQAPQPNCQQYPTAAPESLLRPDNHWQHHQPPPTAPPLGKNNPQSPPPPPAAAAQSNGSHHAPIQQFSPQPQAPPPTAGVPMGRPPLPPAVAACVQPQVLSDTLQYPAEAPQVQVGVGEVPVAVPVLPAGPPLVNGLSTAAPQQGNGLSTAILNGVVKATISLAGKAVEHALFSNNTDPPTGADDAGAAYSGDSAV